MTKPIAIAAYYVQWAEDPGSITNFMEVGSVDARGSFYGDTVEALKEGLRESAVGLPYDALPSPIQQTLLQYTIIMLLTKALTGRNKDEVWTALGILHAFIGSPEHFLIEFHVDKDGNHKVDSVTIGQNDYASMAEAFIGYSKEIQRMREELHKTCEVTFERSSPASVRLDDVMGPPPQPRRLVPQIQAMTVLHRNYRPH